MEGRSDERDIIEACIFKVNEGLLRTNYYAYTPSFISIGPYHHDERSVLGKERLKSEYLQSLLKRTNEVLSRENLLEVLKRLEGRARRWYGDPIRMEGDDKFLEMLLVDGCFVVEFFIRSKKKVVTKGEVGPSTPTVDDWMEAQVVRDMLLMENQLPFFVLKEIYETIDKIFTIFYEEPFLNLVTATFLHASPKLRYFSLIDAHGVNDNEHEIKHLLQVMHMLCCPTVKKAQRKSQGDDDDDFSIESCHIRSASELQEAGVRFKKVGDIDDNSCSNPHLFDIKFNDGVLEIPSFKLFASAETLFRNLIFYEQRSIDVRPKHFSEYAVFMDNLINTEKDVNILRLKGIIMNGLGDDKKVADLFNNLSQQVVYSCHDFYHADVCLQLIQHCKKPWNVLMAKLRRDYFNTPWAGISTAAAILLLLLTAAQTVASFLALNK